MKAAERPAARRASSLRVKLTLWFVAVFSIVQLALVAAVVFFRRDLVRQSLSASAEASVHAMIEGVLQRRPEWTPEQLRELVPAGAGFRLFALRDGAGSQLLAWNVRSGHTLPFSSWEEVPDGPVTAAFAQLDAEAARDLTGSSRPLLLVTAPFRIEKDQIYYLQAAVDDPTLEGNLGPYYADLVVFGVPAGVLAALLAAWLIAGRAVAPIRRLGEAAQHLRPGSIEAGLHVETSDDEVRQLQEELNEALERLRDGYRAQERFISNVSHELKTPVSILSSECQLLLAGDAGLAEHREFARSVGEETKRLAELIESFLTLNRLELTRELVRHEVVPANDLALEAVQRCTRLARRRGVRLVPLLHESGEQGEEALVAGAFDLLRTMLENLLRNALRFSPREGEVTIEVARAGEHVLFGVHDQGPGVPPGLHERIFERYVQGPGPEAPDAGAGLGLSIARNIAHLHNGEVVAAEGRGGHFIARLPAAAPAAAPSGGFAATSPAATD